MQLNCFKPDLCGVGKVLPVSEDTLKLIAKWRGVVSGAMIKGPSTATAIKEMTSTLQAAY